MARKKTDYRSAGVDIDAGNDAVDLIKDKVITKATDIANSKGQQALDAAKQAASDLYQA